MAKGRVRRCEVHFRDKIDRTLSSWICLKGKKLKNYLYILTRVDSGVVRQEGRYG